MWSTLNRPPHAARRTVDKNLPTIDQLIIHHRASLGVHASNCSEVMRLLRTLVKLRHTVVVSLEGRNKVSTRAYPGYTRGNYPDVTRTLTYCELCKPSHTIPAGTGTPFEVPGLQVRERVQPCTVPENPVSSGGPPVPYPEVLGVLWALAHNTRGYTGTPFQSSRVTGTGTGTASIPYPKVLEVL